MSFGQLEWLRRKVSALLDAKATQINEHSTAVGHAVNSYMDGCVNNVNLNTNTAVTNKGNEILNRLNFSVLTTTTIPRCTGFGAWSIPGKGDQRFEGAGYAIFNTDGQGPGWPDICIDGLGWGSIPIGMNQGGAWVPFTRSIQIKPSWSNTSTMCRVMIYFTTPPP